jgi:hypothetical protein
MTATDIVTDHQTGFGEVDVTGSGTDALIDAVVAHRSSETIYKHLNAHLAAGAHHVGIRVFTDDHMASPLEAFRVLAHHRPAR